MSLKTKFIFYIIIWCFTVFSEFSCESSIRQYYDSIYTADLYKGSGYQLNNPESVIVLPNALREVSGLSYLDDRFLLAIQDENGIMYVIDQKYGEIRYQLKFHKNGDYEGVERIGDYVYVVKSNGRIYRFPLDLTTDEVDAKEFKTEMSQKNNVEGLAYDSLNHRLLVALKGKGEVDDNEAKGKCIYTFDLDDQELSKDPLISIDKESIAEIIEREYPTIDLDETIGPSGIAIHPITGKIYLLNHVGKALIVLNTQGKIENYYPLNPSLFHQPEGICFNPKGDLFITNEASSGPQNLMTFPYQKQ